MFSRSDMDCSRQEHVPPAPRPLPCVLSLLSLTVSLTLEPHRSGRLFPSGRLSLTLSLLSGRLSVSVSLTQAALFWKGVSQCLSHGHCCLEDCFSTCLSFEQHCSGRVFLSVSLTRAAMFWNLVSQCVSHTGSIVLEACFSVCLSHGQCCSRRFFPCVSHTGSIVPEGSFSVCLSSHSF